MFRESYKKRLIGPQFVPTPFPGVDVVTWIASSIEYELSSMWSTWLGVSFSFSTLQENRCALAPDTVLLVLRTYITSNPCNYCKFVYTGEGLESRYQDRQGDNYIKIVVFGHNAYVPEGDEYANYELMYDHCLCIVHMKGYGYHVFQSFAPYYNLRQYMEATYPGSLCSKVDGYAHNDLLKDFPTVYEGKEHVLAERLAYKGILDEQRAQALFADLKTIQKATRWKDDVNDAFTRITGVVCKKERNSKLRQHVYCETNVKIKEPFFAYRIV
jgi:hypothetical protein